jgi:oligopeptide transport system ATP-binding protein
MSDHLIEVQDLKKHFPIRGGIFSHTVGWVKAVDGVSLFVRPGETLGLVGESGSGKSTLGRTLLRLTEPTGGSILFEERNVTTIPLWQFSGLRRRLQIIFQDPFGSLNPRMTVVDLVSEGMLEYGLTNHADKADKAAEILKKVGLSADHLYLYPHEFSGGQRQRIAIARVLALQPSFIVCDEPVSALDVSVQSQVINLLRDLQEEYGHAYLFISHDLGVVRNIADRIAVMHGGKLVEQGSTEQIFEDPSDPYTQTLLSAVQFRNP